MASDYKGEKKLFAMKNSKHSAILCLTVLLLVSILAGCASDARPSAWLHGGPDSQGPTLAQYITDECKIDGKQIVKADPLKGWTEGGTTYEQFRAETADGSPLPAWIQSSRLTAIPTIRPTEPDNKLSLRAEPGASTPLRF